MNKKIYMLDDVWFFLINSNPYSIKNKLDLEKICVIPYVLNKDNTKIIDLLDNKIINISEKPLSRYDVNEIVKKVKKAFWAKYNCDIENTKIESSFNALSRLMRSHYLVCSERIIKFDKMINKTIDTTKDWSEIQVTQKQLLKLAKIIIKETIDRYNYLEEMTKGSPERISNDSKEF